MADTPSRSDFNATLQLSVTLTVASIVFCIRAGRDPSCFQGTLQKLQQLLSTVAAARYLDRTYRIPTSSEWRLYVLPNYRDQEFRHSMRMTKAQFFTLVDLINDHPRFARRGNKPQEPVEEQLKVCLYRLGKPAASIQDVAERMGYSIGATYGYFWRCVDVLSSLSPRFVKWPDVARRQVIKQHFQDMSGLPQVIGAIDGCLFPFDYAPHFEPQTFNTYKCRYCVTSVAVCDHELRFTFFEAGDFGSRHDATGYKMTDLYNRCNIYFNGAEYLLADSAYSNITTCITPFSRREERRGPLTAAQKEYNFRHKSARAVIEQAFGRLKPRWRFLQAISVDVDDENCVGRVGRVITACVALHNFILDHPEDVLIERPVNMFERTWARRSGVEPIVHHNEDHDRRVGSAKRQRIVDIVQRFRPY